MDIWTKSNTLYCSTERWSPHAGNLCSYYCWCSAAHCKKHPPPYTLMKINVKWWKKSLLLTATRPISQIPHCTIQNRNLHISVLNSDRNVHISVLNQNGVLLDMGQVHCGICKIGLFYKSSIYSYFEVNSLQKCLCHYIQVCPAHGLQNIYNTLSRGRS